MVGARYGFDVSSVWEGAPQAFMCLPTGLQGAAFFEVVSTQVSKNTARV